MRYLTTTFLLAALAAVLAGCGGGGGGNLRSGSVAKVSGQTITQKQFDDLLDQAKRSYKSQHKPFPAAGSTEYKQLKDQAVAYLVQRIEFQQEAQKLGIAISDKEITKRLKKMKKQYFGGKDSQYQAQIKKQGLTDAQVRDDIRAQLGQEKIFKKVTGKVKVTNAETQN